MTTTDTFASLAAVLPAESFRASRPAESNPALDAWVAARVDAMFDGVDLDAWEAANPGPKAVAS